MPAGRHHRDLKRAIALAAQQRVGNSLGRQFGSEQHHAAAARDQDLVGQTVVELAAQHLHGGGITGARVPGAGPQRFDPHQIVGEVGGLEAVANRSH